MTEEELKQLYQYFENSEFARCWNYLQEKEDPNFIEFVKKSIVPINPDDAFPVLYNDLKDSDGVLFWIEAGESMVVRAFGLDVKEEEEEVIVSIDESKFNCYIYSEDNDSESKSKYYQFVSDENFTMDRVKYLSGNYLKATLVVQRLFVFLQQFSDWSELKSLNKDFEFWIRFNNAQQEHFCELGNYSKKTETLKITADTFVFDSLLPKEPNLELIAERIILNSLYLAAKRDDLDAIKELKEQGAPIHQKRHGLSLSRIALRENDASQVAFYLCEFESEEDQLFTLQEAVSVGDQLVIKKIVEDLHINPNQRSKRKGFSLLHIAAQSWTLDETIIIDIMGYLLSKGLQINQLNNDNETPLQLAKENDLSKVSEFLISKGAR
ncbi:ankyrin repeat domain-containing protein [Flavivirga algicola]|uniref:Ankyrin repeat domain-containing protein n=1 Tax=Flavivirga algicola TaxID=2729136 RepID=A0ABX1RQQ3_9FLAO|nr:ankyrin repeat domain-containing protein [Flavivirga algicola]NMH85887.1 hypothetical protein [Flavivirga algicola]